MKVYNAERFTWIDFWVVVLCAMVMIALGGIR